MAMQGVIVECPHCAESQTVYVDTYLKGNKIDNCVVCNKEFLIWFEFGDQRWITSAGYEFEYEKGVDPEKRLTERF